MQNDIRPTTTKSLLRDTRGLSTVEYVIILALVAIGGIGMWRTFRDTLTGQINAANTEMGQLSTGQ